jgi:hypothetical protein
MSHHLFPNTIIDVEITEMEPFIYFLPGPKSALGTILSFISLLFLFPFATTIEFFKRIILILIRKHKFRIENLLPFVSLCIFSVLCGSFGDGFVKWYGMQLITSWWLLIVGIIAAHHHPGNFFFEN